MVAAGVRNKAEPSTQMVCRRLRGLSSLCDMVSPQHGELGEHTRACAGHVARATSDGVVGDSGGPRSALWKHCKLTDESDSSPERIGKGDANDVATVTAERRSKKAVFDFSTAEFDSPAAMTNR
jgi:hypothetical protein